MNVHWQVSPGQECWPQWVWVFSSERPGWPAGSPSCPAPAVYSHSAFHSLQEREKHYSHGNHLTLQVFKGHTVILLTFGFELGRFCSLELQFFLLAAQLFLQTLVLRNKQVVSLALILMMFKIHRSQITYFAFHLFIGRSRDRPLSKWSARLFFNTVIKQWTTDNRYAFKKEMCCQISLYNVTKQPNDLFMWIAHESVTDDQHLGDKILPLSFTSARTRCFSSSLSSSSRSI